MRTTPVWNQRSRGNGESGSKVGFSMKYGFENRTKRIFVTYEPGLKKCRNVTAWTPGLNAVDQCSWSRVDVFVLLHPRARRWRPRLRVADAQARRRDRVALLGGRGRALRLRPRAAAVRHVLRRAEVGPSAGRQPRAVAGRLRDRGHGPERRGSVRRLLRR